MQRTSAAARPRLRLPREGFALRPSVSQIDFRCDRRFRSHRPPPSSLHGFQSQVANIRPIMHRGLPRINMILRAAAMLFSLEYLSASVKPARLPGLIPAVFWRKSAAGKLVRKGINVAGSRNETHLARSDLAWAISVGGIGAVAFAALLVFAWYFAATLFLIFAGMLLGVALNALTTMLDRVVKLPHALRLTIVCLVLAGLLSGAGFLGGATVAQQATALSDTIKSQLVGVKAFLER